MKEVIHHLLCVNSLLSLEGSIYSPVDCEYVTASLASNCIETPMASLPKQGHFSLDGPFDPAKRYIEHQH